MYLEGFEWKFNEFGPYFQFKWNHRRLAKMSMVFMNEMNKHLWNMRYG